HRRTVRQQRQLLDLDRRRRRRGLHLRSLVDQARVPLHGHAQRVAGAWRDGEQQSDPGWRQLSLLTSPHPEERPQAASRRVATVSLLPTLRDGRYASPPQGEVLSLRQCRAAWPPSSVITTPLM